MNPTPQQLIQVLRTYLWDNFQANSPDKNPILEELLLAVVSQLETQQGRILELKPIVEELRTKLSDLEDLAE